MVFGLIIDVRNLKAYKGEPEVYPNKTFVVFIVENKSALTITFKVVVSYISNMEVVDEEMFEVTLEPRRSKRMQSKSDWVVNTVRVEAKKGPILLDSERTDP